MGCSQSSSSAVEEGIKEVAKRRQSVVEPPPVIQVNVGSNVKFQPPPHTKIVAILGGPGSGKGRLVANLRSMFGMRLISVESIILKYLPKKVAHSMKINSVDEIANLVRKEPSHVSLEWVLRLLQHYVESDPDQIFVVDLVPSLKWLLRDEHLIKDCSTELENFESRCPISFAIHLSLGLDSLDKTLDYSHHNAPPPPGATVGDEADNGRAKASNSFHYIQILVYCSSNTGEILSTQECFCALGFIRGASIACHKQEPSNKGELIFTDMFSVWYTVEPPIRDPPR
jgi:hypothetical protein